MPALRAESFKSPVAEERILFPQSAPSGPDVAIVFDAAGVSKWTASAVALAANVYSKSEVYALLAGYSPISHTHAFSEITSKPTTLSGYGITDAVDIGSTQTITGTKTFASGTITSSTPTQFTQTWNSGATSFKAIDVNITDTTSSTSSLLMDLRVGGTSQFTVTKAGVVTANQLNLTSNHLFQQFSSTAGRLTSAGQPVVDWNANSGLAARRLQVSNANATALAYLECDTNDILDLRRSTTSQCLAVYKTYTSSTSYERGVFDWKTTANTLRIGTEKGSTGGTARTLSLVTDGTARLTVSATAGAFTIVDAATEFFSAGFGLGVRRSDNSTFMFGHSHSQGFLINSSSSLGFAAGADNTPVARVSYTSIGTFLDLRSAGGIRSRLLDNSADAPITASNATFSGSQITLSSLPTSNPGVTGRLWNDAGTLKISA